MNVSDLVRREGGEVWNHFSNGGVAYLCGGARTFGAAVESELMEVFQEHGKMNVEEAKQFLRELIEERRLFEDLAD